MPRNVYTVELDGKQYDIEGDRSPTEAEARSAIGSSGPAGPIPADQQQPTPSYLGDVARYAGGELMGAAKEIPHLITGPLALAKDFFENSFNTETGGPLINIARGVRNQARSIWNGDPQAMGGLLTDVAAMKAPGAEGSGLPSMPVGRIMSAGMEGAKAGLANTPFIGPPIRAAVRGAQRSWAESAPQPPPMEAAPAPAPMVQPLPQDPFVPQATKMPGPQPKPIPEGKGPQFTKPKLTAQQLAQMLRDQYGSEEASRMLYGRSQPGALPRPDAQAAIKRLAPGQSKLPETAKRSIDQGVQSADWHYVEAAPNDLARQYLLSLMRGK